MESSRGIGGVGDPFRDDAAVVYRFLRDVGPATVPNLAEACFPLSYGKDEPLYARLVKGSVRRVLDALVWMRHQGVVITAVPALGPGLGTTFHLGAVEIPLLQVYRVGTLDRAFVTDEVSQPPEIVRESIAPSGLAGLADPWHEGGVIEP
jgi:hypothetical protein